MKRWIVGVLGTMVSDTGPWVTFADAQAALAEKNEEIERLNASLFLCEAALANEKIAHKEQLEKLNLSCLAACQVRCDPSCLVDLGPAAMIYRDISALFSATAAPGKEADDGR